MSISLTNIKSHSEFQAKFEPGVNAIVGPNGSGKSTILEAIGYCLFDSLPYRVTQFIKNGEKEGRIVVRIEHDDVVYYYERRVGGREPLYHVYCVNATGMTIQLALGVEAVQRFTKQLLGLSDEADLKSVFEDAIGVQQGLLTAPFLLTKTKRHAVFQPLFDIDIYRKCFERLRPVESLLAELIASETIEVEKLGNQISALNKAVEEYEGRQRLIEESNKQLKPLSNRYEKKIEMETKLRAKEIALNDTVTLRNRIEVIDKGIENVKERLDEVGSKKDELVKLTPHIKNFKKWKELYDKITTIGAKGKAMGEEIEEILERIPKLKEAVEQYDLSGTDAAKALADKLDEREKSLSEASEERAKADMEYENAENVRKKAVAGECPILGIDCTDLECFALEASEKALLAKERAEEAAAAEREAKLAVKESKEALKTYNRLKNDAAMKQAYERDLADVQKKLDDKTSKVNQIVDEINDLKEKQNNLNFDEEEYSRALALRRELGDEWNERELMERLAELNVKRAKHESGLESALTDSKGFSPKKLEKVLKEVRSLAEEIGRLEGQMELLEKEQPEEKLYKIWILNLNDAKGAIESKKQILNRRLICIDLVKEVRRVFNSVGPEIMEMLLDAINMEANEYYNALTGSPDLLFWDRDFEASIRNVEGKRIFQQLSGGQQMVVAIALRLAVLKHLGNLPIVFLDEPTANLDEERREVLAGVVGNIMGFEQVFVISHGDEFSSEVENVIQL